MTPIELTSKDTQNQSTLIAWRQNLDAILDAALAAGESIRSVVEQRAKATDLLLVHLWQANHLPTTHKGIALIAVGGYGRGEMLPFSDVDVMVLSRHTLDETLQQQVSAFIANMWDVGLAPGVSVRSLEECLDAAKDVSTATSLVESRLIVGDTFLSQIPRKIMAQSWSDQRFFEQKVLEQKQRHAKHNHTEYNLEPDVKNAPGGLRDINQIGWIAKRHFRVMRFYDLVHLGFLTDFEFRDIQDAENFLWQVRYHLHRVCKRNDNRLLFDYQHEIADRMGYKAQQGDGRNSVVERFMKDYYRVAMKVSTLNEMLLAYFYESVVESHLSETEKPKLTSINERFSLIGQQITVNHHHVFSRQPSAILELFDIMAKQPSITGIRARTLRLLMIAAKKIDQAFRNNPEHRAQFMSIIEHSNRLFSIFTDLKRYGVLGNYLPAFGKIIGLMQYDLFHIYTVDAHTLVVLRNLQRFSKAKYIDAYPVASTVFNRLADKRLVYLAALFHDIAKGRGGDHSTLGAADAIEFCTNHGLSQREANIVAWLTENHLLMSLTAQKQDISDLDTLTTFAHKVGDIVHLDYLYTLTVADINATNPTLWNSWRATLLRQLYTQTRRLLRAGLETPVDQTAWIDDSKQKAFAALPAQLLRELGDAKIYALWDEFGDDYFLREQPNDIAWHTQAILTHGQNPAPLVLLRQQRVLAMDAVQIFIYTKDLPNLFAATVATLDQLGLNVQDARIMDNKKNYSLDTYVVLDEHGTLLEDPMRQQEVQDALLRTLSHPDEFPTLVQRRMPRQLKYFSVQTEVHITPSKTGTHHVVELMTLDRPGLLARIGYFFVEHHINILSARIATIGERAEDVFFVTHQHGKLLTAEEASTLAAVLSKALEPSPSAESPRVIQF